MTLTKDDLQAIGEAVRPIVNEEVAVVETRLQTGISDVRAEMRQLFKDQAQQISKSITDAMALIAESYATKEKLEALETEMEDLRKEVNMLKQRLASA